MRFLDPEFGWWALAAFAIVLLLRWRVRWRFAAFTPVLPLAMLKRVPRRASVARRAPFAILAIAAALATLGFMNPVIPYSQAELQSRGLDIVILLDLSSSMQEEMGSGQAPESLRPLSAKPGKTRLDAVKDAVKTFVRSRRDDRIGLVVFSDNPYVISPLTFDHDYLLHYIDMVDDKILAGEGQTAIGDGLALSDYMLSRQATSNSRGHQVIVLFTDGENNRGREPVDVLKEANAADIRVHMVGVDLEAEIKAKPAVQMLVRSIEDSGGHYFDATSERSLLAAERDIDSIEKGLLVSHVYVRDVPVYQWFAIPALVALVAAVGLRTIPYFLDQT
jgi:Ca-activated chloride channel family protein